MCAYQIFPASINGKDRTEFCLKATDLHENRLYISICDFK